MAFFIYVLALIVQILIFISAFELTRYASKLFTSHLPGLHSTAFASSKSWGGGLGMRLAATIFYVLYTKQVHLLVVATTMTGHYYTDTTQKTSRTYV